MKNDSQHQHAPKPGEDHDALLYRLFTRFCDLEPSAWNDAVREIGLDPDVEGRLLDLLMQQSESFPLLDRRPTESFPLLSEFAPTQTIEGYEIIRQIGAGGMGLVYLAEETNIKRHVALKILSSVLTSTSTAVQRFQNEAQSAAQLDHPNIVQVYRFDEWNGTYYIASEYIEGETLAQSLQRVRQEGFDRRWMHTSIDQIRQIALALEYAHQHRVIHRDVKPSNILISADNSAHLADFGVAKSAQSVEMTRTEETPGTVAYMSPEQAGLIEAEVGPRSDVFSLGAVLYECLTLKKLFEGSSSLHVLHQMHEHANISWGGRKHSIPKDIQLVCQKAIERDPRHRYASAGELAADLDRVIRGKPIHARRQPALRRAASLVVRRKAPLAIAGSLAIAVLGVAVPMLIPDPPPSGKLVVNSTTPGAEVFVERYDMETQSFADPVRLGRAPLTRRLEPGKYQITVQRPGAMVEITRDVLASGEYLIDATPAPNDLATAGMLLIPGGDSFVGMRESHDERMGMRRVDMPSFWIDRTEVTNAQYRAYVLATGAPEPRLWSTPYDPAMDDLPVTAIPIAEARAYAEWAGKRLPTAWEWERAARGPLGFSYPWGNEFKGVDNPGNVGVVGNQGWTFDFSKQELRDEVLRRIRPADSVNGGDVSPYGGLNFYGNVAEFTESPVVAFVDAESGYFPGQLQIKGKHWNAEGDGSYTLCSMVPAAPTRMAAGVGFRCARSVSQDESGTASNRQ